MAKPKPAKSVIRRKQKQAKKAKQAQKEQNQNRQKKRQRLEAVEAQVAPQAAPTAKGYFADQIWDNLNLDQALYQAQIDKEGLEIRTILILVIMMGMMNASSLKALSEKFAEDQTLQTIFGLQQLDDNQLYRALASIQVAQYMLFMSLLLSTLQADPRTASRPDGVIAGDTTQIAKPYAHKIPGVHVLFLHSEKRFVRGLEVITTHYADSDKDYPLFCDFYAPTEEQKARKEQERARKAANVDARKPQQVLDYISRQVDAGNPPQLVLLSGNRLTRTFRNHLDSLKLPWLGVSGLQRKYTLEGQKTGKKAKELLDKIKVNEWQEDPNSGLRLADLGLANSTIGRVRLIVTEHLADQVKTLYLVDENISATRAMTLIIDVCGREKACQESGILPQMLDLLRRSRQAGIRAENATFDSWFFVPWFIREVLALGFKRVITKPKATFNYVYDSKSYKLCELWNLLSEKDFNDHQYKGVNYKIASLKVQVAGLGLIKLLFVKQKTRRGNQELSYILMCTDCDYANKDILKVYKLRWRIEVCYREVKQNHAFGCFHARTYETIYGQTMLSLVAYIFVSFFQWLIPELKEESLGSIATHYFGAIVRLSSRSDDPNNYDTLEFPPWIMQLGLLPWHTFILPEIP